MSVSSRRMETTAPMATVEVRDDCATAGDAETEQVSASTELERTAEQPAIEPEPDNSARTLLPFLAAAGVMGVILVAIVLAGLRAPHSSEADRTTIAVQAFVAAHNNNDVQHRASIQCEAFDQARSPLIDSRGRVGLVATEPARVHGDRATMTVTTQADNGRRTADWLLIKAGAEWRVCD